MTIQQDWARRRFMSQPIDDYAPEAIHGELSEGPYTMTSLGDLAAGGGSRLKAEDLKGTEPVLTISEARISELPSRDGQRMEHKLELSFQGKEKSLICNKTNCAVLLDLFGEMDVSQLAGRQIQLYTTKVEFEGKLVDGIRVRGVKTVADEEIPF